MYLCIQVCRKCYLRSQQQKVHNYSQKDSTTDKISAHLNNTGIHDQALNPVTTLSSQLVNWIFKPTMCI